MSTRRSFIAMAMCAATCTAAPALGAPPSAATPRVKAGSRVITDWSAIAARTIFTENATPVPSASLYFGFVSLAVYDAVTTIEGGYQPYLRHPRAKDHASPQVAAATAAYRVLSHYFPASAANLAASYQQSLAEVPNGVGLVHGKRVGEEAAAAIIAAREGDGRGAAITLNVIAAPGVWRPTPDAFAPMIVPWLGFVRPLMMTSPTQFTLPGPDPITSTAYARDFAEVKSYGAKEGSTRTPAQTQLALFYSDNALLQYQKGLAGQVADRSLGIEDSARAFALLNAGVADALIGCWRAKYDYAYWRPITAIREAGTDANSATSADPGWTPLVPTPPYSDYVSGHACITGAAAEAMGQLFGENHLDLTVSSGVTNTTRHYASTDALDADTMNARIWLGLHFRRAMTDGNRLGHSAAAWAGSHYLMSRRHCGRT
jgi:hypothetical protein